MNTYAVILAGGVGERFWPASTKSSPKQFLDIFDDKPLLTVTVDRLKGFVSSEKIIIVTNELHVKQTKLILKNYKGIVVLGEPCGKNTAPAIALAAAYISKNDPESVMMVLSADQIIKPIKTFLTVLKTSVKAASVFGRIVTIGIEPRRADTGLGYIETGAEINETSIKKVFKVKSFKEKPNLNTAKKYLNSGKYLWNSGMFIWRVDTIVDCLEQYMPDLFKYTQKLIKTKTRKIFLELLKKSYHKLEKESIDYGIMEKAKDIAVVSASFFWDDVGSWTAFKELKKSDKKGNCLSDNCLSLETSNSLVVSDSGVVAVYGLDNITIIKREDKLLVINNDKLPSMKNIISEIRDSKFSEFLD